MPEINVNNKPNPEDPNYQQQMIDKANGATIQDEGNTINNEPQEPPEEELLAGKYKTEEDLQKGVLEALKKNNGDKSLEDIYKELESAIHTKTPKEPPEEPNEETPKEPNEEPEGELEDVLAKYDEELMKNGELSEDSYKELKDKGYPERLIDNYIKGLKADADAFTKSIYDLTEGEEQYQAMADWAGKNLDQDEAQAFDDALLSGNTAQAKFAVEALYNRYINSVGREPNLIKGTKASSGSNQGYGSKEEMIVEMSDPRYSKDPVFRSKVEQKIAKSNIF